MVVDAIISVLSHRPGRSLSELNEALPEVGKGALKKLIKELERDGIVERRENARYHLTGLEAQPALALLTPLTRKPPPRYEPSSFIQPLAKERLMGRR